MFACFMAKSNGLFFNLKARKLLFLNRRLLNKVHTLDNLILKFHFSGKFFAPETIFFCGLLSTSL